MTVREKPQFAECISDLSADIFSLLLVYRFGLLGIYYWILVSEILMEYFLFIEVKNIILRLYIFILFHMLYQIPVEMGDLKMIWKLPPIILRSTSICMNNATNDLD